MNPPPAHLGHWQYSVPCGFKTEVFPDCKLMVVPSLESSHFPWPVTPTLNWEASNGRPTLPHAAVSPILCTWGWTEPTKIIQDNFSISRSCIIIPFAESLSPFKVTCSQVLGIRVGTSFVGG